MPRFPMMRVTGSQFISTSRRSSWEVAIVVSSTLPARVVAARELRPVVMPPGLAVDAPIGEATQRADEHPVGLEQHRRQRTARRLIHERHELVREARHGACDADAADVWAAADALHPAALGHVAIDDRTPTADLDLTL